MQKHRAGSPDFAKKTVGKENGMNPQLEVFGALLYGFSQACINLKYIAGNEADKLLQGIVPDQWYPLDKFNKMIDIVTASYKDPTPILERAGEEMMTAWYNLGPGKEVVQKGAGFLSFQTGSEGYKSVVKGPEETVGDFVLENIDIDSGTAVVFSTTPFNRDIERGILIGGMKAPGDLTYVDVSNDEDPNRFEINFL